MTMKKEAIHHDTSFLRFFAIILIVNSHLDKFYPIDALGIGGTIGNSLFFMLSSFGLYLSFQKKPRNFQDFYSRRIRRIYPSVWVLVFALIIPLEIIRNTFDYSNILSLVGLLFWPPFWFLQAIMIYYLFFYFLVKNTGRKKIFLAFLATAVVYVSVYIHYFELVRTQYTIGLTPYCVPFYFLIFLFGICLGSANAKIKYSGLKDVVLLFIFLFLFYFYKFLMFKGHAFAFQFFEQLAVIPLIFYALKISRSKFILQRVMKNPIISKTVLFISSLTLEIYMSHILLRFPFLSLGIPFPLNIIIFVAISIAVAFGVKYMAQILVKRFQNSAV